MKFGMVANNTFFKFQNLINHQKTFAHFDIVTLAVNLKSLKLTRKSCLVLSKFFIGESFQHF